MDWIKLTDTFLILIELALLFTIYQITFNHEIQKVIGAYRLQSILLAFTTGITAVSKMLVAEEKFGFTLFLFILVILLPVLLAIFIEPLLIRATIFTPSSVKEKDDVVSRKKNQPNIRRFNIATPEQKEIAYHVWQEKTGRNSPFASLLFAGLVVLGAAVAFGGILSKEAGFTSAARFGLFVSLVLHLAGLYNTTAKGDILSQFIGLLTMDQGMYLAVVKIVSIPIPATFFVLSLYAYTIITMVLLIYVMPQVRHDVGSIDLDDISEQSTLGG